ncbi:PREDICTED: fatty acyl-CoA hydrolase precursor, medium chain-like [Crocodylus porosus]|uniref:fatty acyl-CoA hydrolase precursor, medium chain-like n=1 Tax=Crocodylus porosus TaxID=8502 RepID=UPI00093A4E45|nr:PREDICTED: fatty acyl-CoA hydrolase precursor, medium chain-like [Crocodylus porosus]
MASACEISLLFALICGTGLTASGAAGQEGARPEVFVSQGRLQGTQARVKGTDRLVNVFLGIPFAKPPVGSLRFAPPEPPEPWTDVRDATSYPPFCPQDLTFLRRIQQTWKEKHAPLITSEDCLFLNIYTPADSDKKTKLPVMVWIHGGNFIFGGASRFDGSALSAYEDVVVVIIQYRLGLLGFFSTGDEHARGNWAYLDQIAALQWIQKNVEHFGGNPGSVTIFGVSAGSVSVSALVLSPLSKGLFHKAISESGTAHLVSGALPSVEVIAQKAAKLYACETTSSVAIVHCLRQKTKEEMVFNSSLGQEVPMIPLVVDGVLLPKSPKELLARKEFNAVPYMIGVTNNEFGWNVRASSNIPGLKEVGDRASIISTIKFIQPWLSVPPEVLPVVINEYLGDTDDSAELRDGFLDLLGDAAIVMPSLETLNYHRESGAATYLFEYQHRPSLYRDTKPAYVKADHADEVAFVFGGPYLAGDIRLRDEATEEEKHLSRTLMKYWANFARNGNPNGEGLAEWPSYNLDEGYLEINLEQKKAKQLKKKRVEFWTKTVPEKIKEKSGEDKKEHEEL